ncbi:MAG: conjugal transfer protein TraL [Alphaproteobacteria bacterium]|nr:conjugal transfer protein TraL [Alphaproteobacteria bacterium]
MRNIIVGALVAVVFLWNSAPAHAASQAECAIWLCLPGGFPSGCGAAHSAFRYRIKHHKPPLPPLASCTAGPEGIGTDGKYEVGYEAFEGCKEGFRLSSNQTGRCEPNDCSLSYTVGKPYCQGYTAARREQPHYIKIWVEDEYLGQFWY